MPLNGLPVALGGVGGSVNGSSAAGAFDAVDELVLLLELGALASGCEPPHAASETTIDENRPNRESKLIAIS